MQGLTDKPDFFLLHLITAAAPFSKRLVHLWRCLTVSDFTNHCCSSRYIIHCAPTLRTDTEWRMDQCELLSKWAVIQLFSGHIYQTFLAFYGVWGCFQFCTDIIQSSITSVYFNVLCKQTSTNCRCFDTLQRNLTQNCSKPDNLKYYAVFN